MAPRYRIALLTGLALMVGCGGPSEQERRTDQAGYARAADAICAKANRAIADHNQRPKMFFFLQSSVQDSRNTLTRAATDLHRLRADLGDAASSQIDAFDDALDPFVKSLDPLTVIAEAGERQRAAALVRSRGDQLYRAAQAAKLSDCGRGGNAIADRALFLNYRDGYIRADQTERRRLLPVDRRPTSAAQATAQNKAVLKAIRSNHESTGRLTPPAKLRRLHQRVRRAQAAIISTREQLAPFTSAADAGDLPARLARQTPAFYRLERTLRSAMNR